MLILDQFKMRVHQLESFECICVENFTQTINGNTRTAFCIRGYREAANTHASVILGLYPTEEEAQNILITMALNMGSQMGLFSFYPLENEQGEESEEHTTPEHEVP